jgi:hypothetical protein
MTLHDTTAGAAVQSATPACLSVATGTGTIFATCLRPRGLRRWSRGVAHLNAVTKLEQLYFKSLEFTN